MSPGEAKVEDRMLVLDTSAWLPYYGIAHTGKIEMVRCLVDRLLASGYQLAYTSVTLYEVRKSPRPSIKLRRREILSFLRQRGVHVGPGYVSLLDLVSFVSEDRRHDAAIAIAAGPHVLLTLDAWQAQFRLAMGAKTIYLDPNIVL